VEQRYDTRVKFETRGDLALIPQETALCLFRISQEALRNAVSHGNARRIALSVVASGESVELTVIDDGTGFDLHESRRRGRGLGLVSMEERAHLIGGDLDISSRPGAGTTIRVRVPTPAFAPVEARS
jgi:two-component system sensor histidine kinase UhpB